MLRQVGMKARTGPGKCSTCVTQQARGREENPSRGQWPGVQGALGLQTPQQAYLPASQPPQERNRIIPRVAKTRGGDELTKTCISHEPMTQHFQLSVLTISNTDMYKEISIKPILCQVTSGTTSKKVPHYLCSPFLTMESHTASNRTVLKLSGIIHEKIF